MPQPTPYTLSYNFTDWQSTHPSAPLPGDQIDSQFNALETTLGGVLTNLAQMQRDDGALKNQVVTIDSLSDDVLSLIGATDDAPEGGGGSVTSVAALTLGTSGTDINSTVQFRFTTPIITLNVPTSSATKRGLLAAEDWSAFNAKQDALVSGANIKTLNGASLVGAGNLNTSGYISVKVATEQATALTSAQDSTLNFTPAANKDYEFEAFVRVKQSAAGSNFRWGIAWPTGLTFGHVVGRVLEDSASGTANSNATEGDASGALLSGNIAVGTGYRMLHIKGTLRTGASPSGQVKVQFCTASGAVTAYVGLGSVLKYGELS